MPKLQQHSDYIGPVEQDSPVEKFLYRSSTIPLPIFSIRQQLLAIYRWLTLQDWAWPTEEDKVVNGRGAKTFKKPIVKIMLTEVQKSGVNGVLMHEALVIDSFDHWDLYKALSSSPLK